MRTDKTVLLLALAYLSFISLGLPDGVLGVAWPSIRAHFHLPLDALAPMLLCFTLGTMLASFNAGFLLSRMNVGVLLAWSCGATAMSLLGYAITPFWWVMALLAGLAGLGAGAIDAGLNTFAATHFSARVMNWLHASYGVGATLGPMIMTGVLNAQQPWQRGYAILGGAQLLLALGFGLSNKLWVDDESTANLQRGAHANESRRVSNWSTLRLPAMWLSIGVFFIYAGIESGTGAWTYSLLTESRGVAPLVAGTWSSVYWGSLTAGRLLSGFVVSHVPLAWLLRGCMLGIALGAFMLWLNLGNGLSFAGFALIGLACAPIFPAFITTTPRRLGEQHIANAVGLQIAAAVLGHALLPSLIGVLARRLSLEIVAPALCLAAFVLLLLHELCGAHEVR